MTYKVFDVYTQVHRGTRCSLCFSTSWYKSRLRQNGWKISLSLSCLGSHSQTQNLYKSTLNSSLKEVNFAWTQVYKCLKDLKTPGINKSWSYHSIRKRVLSSSFHCQIVFTKIQNWFLIQTKWFKLLQGMIFLSCFLVPFILKILTDACIGNMQPFFLAYLHLDFPPISMQLPLFKQGLVSSQEIAEVKNKQARWNYEKHAEIYKENKNQ